MNDHTNQTTEDTTYDVGDPDLKVVQSETSDASYTFCVGDPPWDHDDALRIALEIAGWRYAYLIGITETDTEEDQRQLDADRPTHGHLIKPHAGVPCWESKDATTFVVEQTGTSRKVAAAWLNLDWFGGGEI